MHRNSTSGSRLSLNSLFRNLPIKCLLLTTTLIPFSINASKYNQYNTVINSSTLTVVAVSNPSIVFKDGQYKHGFGYDLAHHYAKSLNVKLEFKTVADNSTALDMVKQGKANFAITTASLQKIEEKKLSAFSATCGDLNSLTSNGLNPDINWVFSQADDPLTATASGFVCQSKQNGATKQLASFYNRNIVKKSDWNIIQQNLTTRLPIYKANFKRSAQQYGIDWHLLAAMGYQESSLKPNSVSPTGVRGLMMLTNATAKEMGVSNRNDPKQSIQGGAKYFDLMLNRYNYIRSADRHWYALVAYNMGPGAVDQIQKQIKAQGKDPNDWINLYNFLNRHKNSNARYKQAVKYVTHIRAYLEHIKSSPKLLEI